MVRSFLKCFEGVKHTCIDIAATSNPDFVGSVLEMPFRDAEFGCVLCCEVLEHIPFADFAAAPSEIRRVSKDLVIISLPDKRRRFGLGACLFRYGWRKLEFNFERASAKTERLATRHYWEIGHTDEASGKNVVKAIRSVGFKIEKMYRLEKHQWHSFFILRRR